MICELCGRNLEMVIFYNIFAYNLYISILKCKQNYDTANVQRVNRMYILHYLTIICQNLK